MDKMVELKSMLTDMMAWFHNYCEENGLKYYAAGGTMLGAARHEGFIPWDDDIDIIMPRPDYERLKKLFQNNGRYILETPENGNKGFYYPFCKLYDTHTTLIEKTKSKIKRGIYLDIFPLDGLGGNREEAFKHFKKVERLNNLLLMKAAGIRKGRALYKNIAVVLFRLVPINPKKLLKKLIKLCAKYKWSDCEWGGNLVGAWRFKEIMPKKIMGNPKLYKFENIMIYGAEDADAYLTNLYGDWRKLPPVEKRVSHHDFLFCDLHKSFLEN